MFRRSPFLLFAATALAQTPAKPRLTLEEFFNFTSIDRAVLSPRGDKAVIATTVPDWAQNRYRTDLWSWREGSGTTFVPLTTSGHDSAPQWSPDGKWVAFLADRGLPEDSAEEPHEVKRVWVIGVDGGEAFPLYHERLEAHSFAWASTSGAADRICFSVQEPWSKQKEEQYKEEWKDVKRWRAADRGDWLIELPVAAPVATTNAAVASLAELPAGARLVTRVPYFITQIAAAPDGSEVAFVTDSPSRRMEDIASYEIYAVKTGATAEAKAVALTRNEAQEGDLQWSTQPRRIFFTVSQGSVEGKYEDVQTRLYSVDPETKEVTRYGASFPGAWTGYTLASDGTVIAAGQVGVEKGLYILSGSNVRAVSPLSGDYAQLSAARFSKKLLFTHSALGQPVEVFLSDDMTQIATAKPVSEFHKLYRDRDLSQGKPYRWKSPDGTAIEGMLLYPPGRFNAKHLRMLTLIHGGPGDADGNSLSAMDWYQWATLAASNDWLVFQPNYRGSSGYGDDFMRQIVPHLVSAPGHDILSGVDALVRDGIADPDRLAIGGYSYGGYMTNWLLTQTTRFKAAVTGAGTVEHAANWGNDDDTFDDSWFLGGPPWANPSLYQAEAALFQLDKVRTPTLIVFGADDLRVSAGEGYLLERALYTLGVPSATLIFPDEGHDLGKNPWHGRIKVREELKWLEKYDPASGIAK